MDKENKWDRLHPEAKKIIPECNEQLTDSLAWARQFVQCDTDLLNKYKEPARLYMWKIDDVQKHIDSDTPQRVKDIIAEARETYEKIMKLN